MYSGALTSCTHTAAVMPAEAGIQTVPGSWIPAYAGMTGPLYLQITIATCKIHNTL
jgi:hypothetical protein